MKVIVWLEKYGLLLMALYCLEVFTPDFGSKVIESDLTMDAFNERLAGSNLFKQAFWILAWLFFTIRYLFNTAIGPLKRNLNTNVLLLLLLCGFALLSALWSDYPFFTLKRAIFQVLFCCSLSFAVCFAIYHGSLIKTFTLAAWVCIGLIMVSLLLGGGINTDLQLSGFVSSKNTLGKNLLVLFVLGYVWTRTLNVKDKWLQFTLLALAILLLMTQSKTNMMLLFIFVLLMQLSLFKLRVIMTSVFLMLTSVFVFIPAMSYYLNDYQHIALYVDAEFFTGRGLIWDALYYDLAFFQKMALGYGYGSYFEVGVVPFTLDDKYSFLQFITSAHNGYLQLLLQFGLLGTFLVSVMLMLPLLNIRNSFLLAALIVPLIQNVTESTLFRDTNMVWFLMIVIIASARLLTVNQKAATKTQYSKDAVGSIAN